MKEENAIVNLIYQVHKNIKENLVILNEALSFVKTDGFWKTQENVFSFFDTHVVTHFKNEEIIFDVAKKHNKMKSHEYEIIEQIIEEHKDLLERYERLKPLMGKGVLAAGDNKNRFIDAFRDIMKVIVKHAEKEDDVIFPMLQKYMDDKQFEEADRIIKKNKIN